jgi:hypothetical protein
MLPAPASSVDNMQQGRVKRRHGAKEGYQQGLAVADR